MFRSPGKWLTTLLAVLGVAVIAAAPAIAQSDIVTASAALNGQDAAAASTAQPLRLRPNDTVEVVVTVTNGSGRDVEIHQIQFDGRVLGLTLFSYTTAVEATVAAHTTGTVRYRLELTGLRGQATGLIRSAVTVRDQAGDPIAVIPTLTDVRGSLVSVYGLFGAALAVLTALALADAALALARHRLSTNRWLRGLRLLTPGIGIGLVLVFSASVARLWVADARWWMLVAGATAAVSFGIGYLSPTPDDGEPAEPDDIDDDYDYNGCDSQAGAVAVADLTR